MYPRKPSQPSGEKEEERKQEEEEEGERERDGAEERANACIYSCVVGYIYRREAKAARGGACTKGTPTM